ncbi:hypothetical protein ACFYMI_13055 [Streptomyces collinus]|uniref:hypothetical protein n=1 Tax=Streptomyces collinus TaxID=42684 RepID=UPI00369EF658
MDERLGVRHHRGGTACRRTAQASRAQRPCVQGPAGLAEQRVNAPCAFFPPQPTNAGARRLYEDAGGSRLICSLDEPQGIEGRRHYEVRDAQGWVIGKIQRIAPLKHAVKLTWRIVQLGHPEIVSSAEWACTAVSLTLARRLPARGNASLIKVFTKAASSQRFANSVAEATDAARGAGPCARASAPPPRPGFLRGAGIVGVSCRPASVPPT